MDTNKENPKRQENDWTEKSDSDTSKAQVTHNLDTGEDEPLTDLEDKNIMDFGSGSGGGSAGDGGAA